MEKLKDSACAILEVAANVAMCPAMRSAGVVEITVAVEARTVGVNVVWQKVGVISR